MSQLKLFLKIGFNMLSQIIGKGIIVIIGLITVAFLTRYLGKTNYGYYTLAFAYTGFFSVIADFGMQVVVIRDLSHPKIDKESALNTYFYLKILLVITSTFLAIVSLIFFPYPQTEKIGIILAALGVSVSGITGFNVTLLNYKVRLDLVSLLDVITRVTTVVFILIGIFFNLGFYFIITTVLFGNLIGLISSYFLVKEKITLKIFFDKHYAKKLFYAAIPIGSSLFIYSLYVKIDSIILSLYKPVSEVGIYNLAFKVFENILVLWSFYIGSIYPIWTKLYHRKDYKKLHTLIKTSFVLAISSSILLTLLTYIFAPFIILILGSKNFSSSIIALRIIAFALPFYFLNGMFYYYFLTRDKKSLLFLGVMLALILNVVVNFIFIPKYGFIAASYITVFTEMLLSGYYILIFFRYRFSV